MLLKTARKITVAVIGGTVLLLGVIMLVTPGPGIVGVVAGLAILATEFALAARLLKNLKQRVAQAGARVGLGNAPPPEARDGPSADLTGVPPPVRPSQCAARPPETP